MPERSVLVVDDDPSILDFYRRIFRDGSADDLDILGTASARSDDPLGCRLFQDPKRMLDEYAGSVADGDVCPLAILDMRMPGMDGLEAARELRRIDPRIEIILCSAYSDKSIPQMRDRLGEGFYFVRKPFPPDEFRLLVDSLCVSWERHRELAEQRRRMEEILDATQAATWEWDVAKGDVVFNERWARIAGYAPDEIAPRIESWTELCHPDDLATSQEEIQKHFRGETPGYDLECRMRHRDGRWIWVRDRGKVVEWNPDGTPRRMSGTHTDITDKRTMQDELRRSYLELSEARDRDRESAAKAQEASRAKSEFVANMSHEIRTPLNGILGMVELLARTTLNDEQRRYADLIRTSGRTLLELVGDILDFSKIEARKLEISSTDFDLHALADEIDAMFFEPARLKGVGFECRLGQGVPTRARGDARRIRQILTNLCGNAIKFTERGRVRLALEASDAFPGRPGIVATVSDTGIGIDESARGRLFQPFTQADGSTTRRFGGTGLGLVISRQLAEAMGGGLELASSSPGGSVFRLEIPLEEALPGSAEASPSIARPASGLDGIRVLVVEDNTVNQMLMEKILQALNCVPTTASNGAEAIQLLSERDFDLVLMDCQMPVMDGFAATERIRAAGSPVRDRSIPVVALTANAFDEDRDRCHRCGMDDYLAKPLQPEVLIETILRWTGSNFGPVSEAAPETRRT